MEAWYFEYIRGYEREMSQAIQDQVRLLVFYATPGEPVVGRLFSCIVC